MSLFSRRNSMSVASYVGLMPVPIVTVWLESPGTSSMVWVCVIASKAEVLLPSELGFLSMVGSSLLTPLAYLAGSSAWLASAAMTASASSAPLASHSAAMSGSPWMVMTPRGPGSFIALYA